MPAGYEGYAALGDLLGGGADQRAELNGAKYRSASADAAYKFNQAAEERSKALIAAARLASRQALPDAVNGVYTDPKQAALLNAVLGSNETINMSQTGKFQTPGYTALVQEQQDALAKGDFKRMNAVTSVLGDKQFEPVITKGGAFIENGATLGDLDAIPTPTSLATIEQKEAQGKAALIRANKPPAARSSHSRPSAAGDEAAILEQARAALAKGAKKSAVKKRLEDRGYSKLAARL